jgi:hypothetical protein
MSDLSGHVHYESVGIKDIAQMAFGLALGDNPLPLTNQGLFVHWVSVREAAKLDLKPSDLEIEAVDIMAKSPDGFYFSVEFWWWVSCDMCENTAITHYSADGNFLCRFHGDEGYQQEQADLENDDRAIGMS